MGPWKRLERQLSVTQASHREDSPEAHTCVQADQGSVTQESYFGLSASCSTMSVQTLSGYSSLILSSLF